MWTSVQKLMNKLTVVSERMDSFSTLTSFVTENCYVVCREAATDCTWTYLIFTTNTCIGVSMADRILLQKQTVEADNLNNYW
jgi:hypothetical protein